MRGLAPTSLVSLLLIGLAPGPAPACTSFCLDTPEGPYFGTNLDLEFGDGLVFVNPRGLAKESFRTSTTGETAKWVSEYGSVTFNLAGREFAWGGLNEAGLAMSSMQLMVSQLPEPGERVPFDAGALVQYVLDTCGNVEEAIARISQVTLVDDAAAPSHFLLADAAGNCAGIEYVHGELVSYTGDELPIRAMANAPYAASLAFAETGIPPQFNPGESVERVAAAADRMESFRPDLGISPVDYCLSILTETVVAPKKWWSNLFGEPYTRWSVVFDLARREVHFRTVESPQVKRLALAGFDLSCTSPPRMLDVNAELEGTVEEAFTPYEHEANLEVFRSFCDRWGIHVPEEDAVGLMRSFEGFECAPETPPAS